MNYPWGRCRSPRNAPSRLLTATFGRAPRSALRAYRCAHYGGNLADPLASLPGESLACGNGAGRPRCGNRYHRPPLRTGWVAAMITLMTVAVVLGGVAVLPGGRSIRVRQPLDGPAPGADFAERVPRWHEVWVLLVELVLESAEGAFALDGAGQPAGDRSAAPVRRKSWRLFRARPGIRRRDGEAGCMNPGSRVGDVCSG